MGNTTSTISVDELKNQLLGSAVFLLAPKLDGDLHFKKSTEITETDEHVLPFAVSKDLMDVARNYYSGDAAVEKYVVNHVLDSREHLEKFVQSFVTKLRPGRQITQTSRVSRNHDDQSVRADHHKDSASAVVSTQLETSPAVPDPVTATATAVATVPVPAAKVPSVGRSERRSVKPRSSLPSEHMEVPLSDEDQHARSSVAATAGSKATNVAVSKGTSGVRTSDHIDRKLRQLNSAINRERKALGRSVEGREGRSNHASRPEIDINDMKMATAISDQATNDGEYEQESN